VNNSRPTNQHNGFLGKIAQLFAFLCSIILLATVTLNEDFFLLTAVFIYLFFLLFIIHVLAGRKAFLSPVLFSIFISIGFILKLSSQIANKNLASVIGWHAVGTFGFSLEEMVGLFLVIICGFFGVLVGVLLFEKFANKRMETILSKQDRNIVGRYGGAKTLIILWFAFYLFSILIMWKLGIGRHGFSVTADQVLPFKLVGILTYLRNIYFPTMACVIIDILLFKRKYSLIMVVFFLFFLLTAIVSMVSFSRGAIIIPMALFSIFVFANYRSFNLRLSRLFFICVVFFIAVVMVSAVVLSMRSGLYAGSGSVSGVEIETVLAFVLDIDFQQGFDLFFQTLTSRIEGTRELMAVYSSSFSGFGVFWDAFIGADIPIYENVFGFSMAQAGRAYGVTAGMLGLLFLSKSFFVVFAGSVFYAYLFMAIEYIFVKKGYRMTAFYLSSTFVIFIWMNMDWFLLIRLLAMVVLLYLTITIIDKRKVKLTYSGEEFKNIGKRPILFQKNG
jgi:hypothetical protein